MLAEFDSILRFWFDRGIDGFRIDVADSMSKDDTLPDVDEPRVPGQPANKYPDHPHWDRDEVHDIHRRWRRIADEYDDRPGGARTFVAEAWVTPPERLARYLRPDELHCAFNFDALKARWDARSQRRVIDDSTEAIWAVGAPATWVLSNHDTIRHRTRYGRDQDHASAPAGAVADLALGLRRARAAALLELALPGGAYIYQGDELGLPEVEDLPEDVLDDPIWERSGRQVRGRDGCRVPMPWSGTAPPFGFGPDGSASRGCPSRRAGCRSPPRRRRDDPTATSRCTAPRLRLRRQHPALGDGRLEWVETVPTCCASIAIPVSGASSTSVPSPCVLPAHARCCSPAWRSRTDLLPSDGAAWLSR